MDKIIDEVYLHISNGGVTFSIIDSEYGPKIQIHSSTFGNNDTTKDILVEKEALLRLSELFKKAYEYQDFADDYVHCAKLEKVCEEPIVCDDQGCSLEYVFMKFEEVENKRIPTQE